MPDPDPDRSVRGRTRCPRQDSRNFLEGRKEVGFEVAGWRVGGCELSPMRSGEPWAQQDRKTMGLGTQSQGENREGREKRERRGAEGRKDGIGDR